MTNVDETDDRSQLEYQGTEMIDPDVILTQIDAALAMIDQAGAGRLAEDERVGVAEMIINLQMQLDMLGEAAHARCDSRLNDLKAAAESAGIEWQLA